MVESWQECLLLLLIRLGIGYNNNYDANRSV